MWVPPIMWAFFSLMVLFIIIIGDFWYKMFPQTRLIENKNYTLISFLLATSFFVFFVVSMYLFFSLF